MTSNEFPVSSNSSSITITLCTFGGLIFWTCSVLEPREGKSRNFIQPEKYMAWKEQLVLVFLIWIIEGTKGQG